jgi:hypothetical protein
MRILALVEPDYHCPAGLFNDWYIHRIMDFVENREMATLQRRIRRRAVGRLLSRKFGYCEEF